MPRRLPSILAAGTLMFFPAGAGEDPLPAAEDARVDAEVAGTLSRVILTPWCEATLSAETAGKVVKIHFHSGDAFQQGDELLTLDDTFFRAAKEKAAAALKAAETALQAAVQLRARNDASLVEVENARRDVAAARAEVALAERNFSSCHVRAPYAGRVAEVFPNEFELIETGRPLLKIIDDGALLGHVFLPGAFYGRVRNGQTVTVWIEETAGRKSPAVAQEKTPAGRASFVPGIAASPADGVFLRVAPLIDAASGYFSAQIKIANSARRFHAGTDAWLKPADLPERPSGERHGQ